MQPLSPILYFARNLRRTLPVLGIIALAVVGVLVVAILAESQMEDPRRDYFEPMKIYARVYPRKGTLDPNLGAILRAHPDVERVVRVLPTSVRGIGMMGSRGFPVRGLPEREMEWYMEANGVTLAEGRLPQGSSREIALNSALMRSKGLSIGDWVGRDLDPDEWLPGKFQVVGRLEGAIQVGLVTAPALREYVRSETLEVFAKPGRIEALDQYLQTIISDYVGVDSITPMTIEWERETGTVTPILLAINGITVIVLSLAVGLLNQIYFLQRIPEYGILMALGYRTSYLIRRTLVEALALTVIGWLLGLGLSYGINWALLTYVFTPMGMTLAALSSKIALTTVPIPVLIAVFSLTTVVRRILTMDPVSIVERRD